MGVIGSGSIGGKANGFFLAQRVFSIPQVMREYPVLSTIIRFPETTCVGIGVYRQFVEDNQLTELVNQCERLEPGAEEALEAAMLNGHFRDDIVDQLRTFLKSAEYPLAVRSSSLLEDRTTTSFAGKYHTTFIANRGSIETRLEQLLAAIKLVYASIGCRSAIVYRRKHRLLRAKEEMGVMLQRAIGREYNDWFFPLAAGVGFSSNTYCWSPEIKKEDGLVRIVFGLGTRAVGRGYARLFSPGMPTSRPEGFAAADIERVSQATMDALNLTNNTLESIHFSQVVKNGFQACPGAERLFSLRDGQTIYVPATKWWNPQHRPVITFDQVLQKEWGNVNFPVMMSRLLKIMENHFKTPVDIEFAILLGDQENETSLDGESDQPNIHLYLLQCRPLTQREELNPGPMPDVKKENILFSANRNVRTGDVDNIEYIVLVDADRYFNCPQQDRHAVARVVGKINHALEGKRFILMGPGRWGSVKIELGVPVRYEEISHAAMLVEMAKGGYSPELSFGTHFFQDLIEDQIQYLPISPDDPEVAYNEAFLSSNNMFSSFITDPAFSRFSDIVRVIHIPSSSGGRLARAIMNSQEEAAMVYLKDIPAS